MNRYVTELVGTFFLVLTILLTAGTEDSVLVAPIAIAAVLVAVIYAGGHISYAHYNPVVTLAFWLRGRCPRSDVPGYVVAQALGAVLAAVAAEYLTGETSGGVADRALGPLVVAELLFTFARCWVILNVATTEGTAGTGVYGLAIGCTV
ncbi:MAG: aquaporin, partial [Acidobacteriota bacterium]